MLRPVDAVVEPVEDDEKHRDGAERDDRLELLAVARQRVEHGLRDEPRRGRRNCGRCYAAQKRPAEAALLPDHARDQGRDDEDGLQTFAEDDHRRVRDHRRSRRRPGAHRSLGIDERSLEGGERRRELLRSSRPLHELSKPSWPSAPYQNSPSTRTKRLGASPRNRCSGPNSKTA